MEAIVVDHAAHGFYCALSYFRSCSLQIRDIMSKIKNAATALAAALFVSRTKVNPSNTTAQLHPTMLPDRAATQHICIFSAAMDGRGLQLSQNPRTLLTSHQARLARGKEGTSQTQALALF